MSAQRARVGAEPSRRRVEPTATVAESRRSVTIDPPLAESLKLTASDPLSAGLLSAEPLWPSDTGTLRESSRRALAALIKGPYLSAERQSELWRALVSDTPAIQSRLADLFLELVLDPVHGVAFVRNVDLDAGAAPQVVRTMSLTFMDTLLLLNLRSELLRSVLGSRVIVGKDEVYEQLHVYRSASSTDEAGFTKRINAAWKKMVDHSLLLRTSTEGRFEVSPVLRLVFGPDEIAAISAEYQQLLIGGAGAPDGPANPIEEDDDAVKEDDASEAEELL